MMGCGFNFTLISSKTETLFTPFSNPVLDSSGLKRKIVCAGAFQNQAHPKDLDLTKFLPLFLPIRFLFDGRILRGL
jgi:hypothetical protein